MVDDFVVIAFFRKFDSLRSDDEGREWKKKQYSIYFACCPVGFFDRSLCGSCGLLTRLLLREEENEGKLDNALDVFRSLYPLLMIFSFRRRCD